MPTNGALRCMLQAAPEPRSYPNCRYLKWSTEVEDIASLSLEGALLVGEYWLSLYGCEGGLAHCPNPFPTLLSGVPERLVIELTSSHDDAEKHSALGAMEANTRDLTLIQRRKLTLVLAFVMHLQSAHGAAQRA